MFKAKQKTVSMLLACLTLFAALILGFTALFSAPQITASAATNGEYVKVTSAPTDWEGKYLIVYETGTTAYVFNGVDDANAHYKTTTNGSAIQYDTNVSTYEVEIKKSGTNYTIKSYKGYIGQTSNANGIKIQASALNNTITFKSASQIDIVSGGAYLRFNASSGQYRFRYYKSSTYTGQKAIVLYKWTETECTHEGTLLSWKYDSEKSQHYQQCECGAEIEDTRGACSYEEYTYTDNGNGTHKKDSTCTVCERSATVDASEACTVNAWSEWAPNGGTHSREGECQYCGATVTETEACEVEASGYVREGDQHSQTGTCQICGDETVVTEACTLSYKNVPNGDKTHTMTSTCSVCEQTSEPENVACSFDEGVLDAENFILTYTCEYCEYSYTEAATTYTVSYVVPNGIGAVDSVTVAEGYTTALASLGNVEENGVEYTFVGWVEAELDEKTEIAPEALKAGATYTVTEDVTFYALYSYKEGTGAFTKVTDASKLAVGAEIVIVASGSADAMCDVQDGNNRKSAAVTKSGDTVTWTTNVQVITLEEGKVGGTFAFNVGTGYLYAASSGSNHLKTQTTLDDNGSWKIEINADGVATIKAQGTNTRNWLRYNSSNNPPLFSCYGSGQSDVSIYMKDGSIYYVTSFNTCAHANVNEVIEEATCLESGSRTVTCLDCETVIVAEILPALGHNFVDGICENCAKQDPASIVYDGYYYLSINGKYAGEKDGNYYKLFDYTIDETIELNYIFYFVNNGDTYDMYNMDAGLIAKDLTIQTQENYAVNIFNGEGKVLAHNTGYSNYQRMGFYSATGSYPRDIILTAVDISANIDSASITIGQDISLNYYVTMSDVFKESATMCFTVNGTTRDVFGVEVDGRYVFTLAMPPQYMATNVKAELKFGDIVLATEAEYSIKTYAQNQLNKIALGEITDEDGELKQLLTDLLYYGDAAYNYVNKTTGETPATAGFENLTASDATPTTTDFELINAELPEGVSYGAWFTAAGVHFDNVNKIYVKLNTTENVTLKINGVEVTVDNTTVYTDGILATGFAETYTFELYYDGVLMQTLRYSVNAYAHQMQNDGAMGDLALALYRYGVSAAAYNA